MGCSNFYNEFPKDKPFTGCDGKPWDDEFLSYHMEKAAQEDDFEYAIQCRDELARRMLERHLNWLNGQAEKHLNSQPC